VHKAIRHFSFSPSGGAGGVAHILSAEQSAAGCDSALITRISSNLRNRPLSAPLHTLAAATDEYILKKPGFAAPISVARDALSIDLGEHLTPSTIVHLHGINGTVSLEWLSHHNPHQPIVWTLHDMNPFTGACHYSLGCSGFQKQCTDCPAVRGLWHSTVTKALARKTASLARFTNLRLVAPSTWLADQALQAPATQGIPITVIPNPIRDTFFDQVPDKDHEGAERPTTVVAVAQNLDDPVKDIATVVSAFRSLASSNPRATLLLVGRGGHRFASENIHVIAPVDSQGLCRILDSAQALVVASVAENAPLVIAEAGARGCVPVVRAVGGMPEMVSLLGDGSVFSNEEELATHLGQLLATSPSAQGKRRKALTSKAHESFSARASAAAYAKVYGDLE